MGVDSSADRVASSALGSCTVVLVFGAELLADQDRVASLGNFEAQERQGNNIREQPQSFRKCFGFVAKCVKRKTDGEKRSQETIRQDWGKEPGVVKYGHAGAVTAISGQ